MSKIKSINLDGNNENGDLLSLEGMYKEYFLDYASYVILERAVPTIEDGLKPVQRRLLHSMKRKNCEFLYLVLHQQRSAYRRPTR